MLQRHSSSARGPTYMTARKAENAHLWVWQGVQTFYRTHPGWGGWKPWSVVCWAVAMFLQEKRGVNTHGSTTTTTSEISCHLNSIWTFRRTARGQGGGCLFGSLWQGWRHGLGGLVSATHRIGTRRGGRQVTTSSSAASAAGHGTSLVATATSSHPCGVLRLEGSSYA
jgi:hypothetical protein